MAHQLKGLQPERVFHFFEEISQIPRESGNELAIAKHLEAFGQSLGFRTERDEHHNVIIYKPASAGMEAKPTVILQGHSDMVCVKEDGLDFDFATQPIPLVVDGDMLRTAGTTLGADNGIAVAMMMAILEDSSLVHPPLVCLITATEETGMDGVMGLKPGQVRGDILINLDSEEEGKVLTSCAGGINHHIMLVPEREPMADRSKIKLIVSGLSGGHSGIEINTCRANAIKLLGRVASELFEAFDVRPIRMSGGEKMNAIAKRAEGAFAIRTTDRAAIEAKVAELEARFRNEYSITEPGLKLELVEPKCGGHGHAHGKGGQGCGCGGKHEMLTAESAHKVIALLRLAPFGPQSMSAGVPGLVESSMNLGLFELPGATGSEMLLRTSIRSSVRSLKYEIVDQMEQIAKLIGARTSTRADYPEWQFKEHSPVRELMIRVYHEMTGKELEVAALHAGLECGFLTDRVGDIDMVSMGPNLHDVHTPKERLSISSTARVYDFLLKVLSRI
ncbi:MAG: aminoacyl-histidine dipeptidase [Bacillota bacterium]|nr:aminoacyl-histidine dipeptidase [Bacillota bacterium]